MTRVDEFASYYALAVPAFKGFLGSLGLRRWDTSAKPSFDRVRDEASRRGF